ncbi:MAG TPA: SCPU domain-containing protein [Deltaproteobacteria bacterium]|nr:SCPU domain-containing protein [Deltaproteobacteria bacterium]
MKGARVLISAFALVLLLAGTATAQCRVFSTGVDFGTYDVFDPVPTDSVGLIVVWCTQRANVTVAIGPSPNSGGFNPRSMKHVSAAYLLNYNLYTDRNRTQIWGDGTAGTSTVTTRVNRIFPRLLRVYGRIPPAQDVLIGTYTETLVVTITW